MATTATKKTAAPATKKAAAPATKKATAASKKAAPLVKKAAAPAVKKSVAAAPLKPIKDTFTKASLTIHLAERSGVDLTVSVATKRGDQSSLLFALGSMRDNLAAIVGRMRTGTDAIATASRQISAGNSDLSSRTEEQAASLEETASSMEELTSTVKQNAENAQQASALAANASEVAHKGSTVVGQVVDTMTDINQSSTKIAEITGIIEGIAFQTNILALNAAVEAARAGEQGRGFAVVASEVRSLAQRSSSAAKEIKDLITVSVQKFQNGSTLADEASKSMSDVTLAIGRVTDIMGEIAATSSEQSRGIEQINQAVTQMDEVTQQNAALVEEAGEPAGRRHESARRSDGRVLGRARRRRSAHARTSRIARALR